VEFVLPLLFATSGSFLVLAILPSIKIWYALAYSLKKRESDLRTSNHYRRFFSRRALVTGRGRPANAG
jgi:hypothetical protein